MAIPNIGAGYRPGTSLPVNSSWSEFYYAGVNFGPFTHITNYDVEVIYDARGSRAYNRFTLTCTSTITWDEGPGSNDVGSFIAADALATRVRQALTTQGGVLLLRGRAVGVMAVNVGGVRDIMNGPVPQQLGPEVLGELTSRFEWTLTWHLPDCPAAVYTSELGTLSNTNTISTTVENGYTTRTISGQAVIPQSRAVLGANFPADAATKFLRIADGRPGSLFPAIPFGFRRGPYTCTLNESRSTLSYSVVDTQNGYQNPPPGCITAEESYEEGTSQDAALATWSATFSGRYEIPYNGNVNDATNAFWFFVGSEIKQIQKMLADQKDANGNPTAGGPNGLIPTAVTLSDPDRRGRRIISLSLSVRFVTGLDNVLEQSGIWRPLANGNWQTWSDSMNAAFVFSPRGTAELDFNPALDNIVSLCAPSNDLGNRAPTRGRLNRLRPRPPILEGIPNELRAALTPLPGQDWLWYNCHVYAEDDDGVNQVVTLPTKPLTGVTDLVATDFNAMVESAVRGLIAGGSELISGSFGPLVPPAPVPPGAGAGGGGAVVPPGAPTNVGVGLVPANLPTGTTWVERRKRPARYIWFVGSAGRYGSPILEPGFSFCTIGGVQYPLIRCQRAKDGPPFEQMTYPSVNVAGGSPTPIYAAVWHMRFGIVGPLNVKGPVETPPNPWTGK